jgi:hypothetical protein
MRLYIKFRFYPQYTFVNYMSCQDVPPTALLQNGFLSAEGYLCALVEYQKLHLHMTGVFK